MRCYYFPERNSSGKYSGILLRADFVARFEQLDTEQPGTPVSFFEQVKHPPEPVKDHERPKKVLNNKRRQLPGASRGIIVLDVSEPFMLNFRAHGVMCRALRHSLGTPQYCSFPQLNLHRARVHRDPGGHVQTALPDARKELLAPVHCSARTRIR